MSRIFLHVPSERQRISTLFKLSCGCFPVSFLKNHSNIIAGLSCLSTMVFAPHCCQILRHNLGAGSFEDVWVNFWPRSLGKMNPSPTRYCAHHIHEVVVFKDISQKNSYRVFVNIPLPHGCYEIYSSKNPKSQDISKKKTSVTKTILPSYIGIAGSR